MPFKNPHPLYAVWHSMKERCRNTKFRQWENYGGRGISVCSRWLEKNGTGFRNFVADIGNRPEGYQLDRIDNDGDYTPSNCRWASRKEQQRNQTVTRRVTIEGVEYVAADLAEKHNLKTDTIVNRSSIFSTYTEITQPERHVFTEGLKLGGKANGARQKSKTHCPKGHPFDEKNTAYSKDGWRRCLKCHAEKEAERRNK